ncbi:MAG TPA: hypothetical protein VG963_01970 [Polyangiaceae bacterium]|nr:hypothetical protein [Polyangiaceae bacterium]
MSAVTAQQYFAGTVRAAGYPANYKFESEATNLHPKYRVPCERGDYTQLTRARLRTLEFLVRWFGPVPGSYQGPYPDRATAWALARSAFLSLPPAALSQPFVVQGETIRLSPSDIRHTFIQQSSASDDSNPNVALKLFEGTCLLIGHWSGENYRVEMIDTSRIGWFARYEFNLRNLE